MKPAAILVLAGLLLTGCAGEQTSLLDQELLTYRYEQEKYRREDLEALYREEAALSDDISDRILALRSEIAEKETELAELEMRLAELEESIRAARAKVTAAPDPVKPKPAGEKPAGEKPAGEKPAVEKPAVEKPAGEKPTPKPPAK